MSSFWAVDVDVVLAVLRRDGSSLGNRLPTLAFVTSRGPRLSFLASLGSSSHGSCLSLVAVASLSWWRLVPQLISGRLHRRQQGAISRPFSVTFGVTDGASSGEP